MCRSGRRCCGIAKRSALIFHLVALRLRQAMVQWQGAFCMAYYVGPGLEYAWPYHERVGSWFLMERMVNMSGDVHISDPLVWYERGGLYVPCSHLRVAASREVRSWMHMRVELQAGKSVELDHERAGSCKHWNP